MSRDSLPAAFALLLALVLAACSEREAPPPATGLQLLPAAFAELPGWESDKVSEALPALQRSCAQLMKQPATAPVGPGGLAGSVADWQGPCGALPKAGDEIAARQYLEGSFRPFLVTDGGRAEGLFTGYYEPEVAGALAPDAGHRWPLYGVPQDLVTVKLGRFRADLEGTTLSGRVEGGELVPYYTREAIDADHVLTGRGLEIIWLADYIDLFFLQVQGSGRVMLSDGRVIRVGYAGNNGHPFTAIGRLLIDSGQISREQASMQSIRDWLRAHPDQAWAVMRQNARYIFFRRLEGEGPLGAQGVALTPGRSLAIDPRHLPLGAPLWLSTTWPASDRSLQRLMVAQDTGSAIEGIVRGDFFWGAGEEALAEAGRMKQQGRYWLLLPRAVAERRNAGS